MKEREMTHIEKMTEEEVASVVWSLLLFVARKPKNASGQQE